MKSFFPALLLCFYAALSSGQALSEKYLQNETVTYDECISFYKSLDKKYDHAKL
jgi:hypothetical protein